MTGDGDGGGATTFSIMTFSITTFSITTFSIMTLSIMTLSITTLSIMTLSIEGFIATLSIMAFSANDNQHNSTSAIMLSFIMLSVAFYLLIC